MAAPVATSPAAIPTESFNDETPHAVELRDVTKRYTRRGRPALASVSTTFARASMTAVMGLSGSGKSTLLQCAAGLDRPSAGSVLLGGTDLGRLRKRRLSVLRRRRVGFVFQSLNLVPTLSVADNIALPLRLDHQRVRRAEVSEMADRVGVADLLRRLPATLSGGQQQRVAIARALITQPEVVFADEPTAALDPYTANEVEALLRWAVTHLGQTVVVVTHSPELAARADRALLLHAGELVEDIDRPDPRDLANRVQCLGGVSA